MAGTVRRSSLPEGVGHAEKFATPEDAGETPPLLLLVLLVVALAFTRV